MSKRNRKGKHVKGEKITLRKGDVATISASKLEPQVAEGAKAKPNDGSPTVAKTIEGANAGAVVNLPPEVKPARIKVLKPDTKFRGAREAWFIRLKQFDGKPVDDYIADCKERCPQLTKANTAENPTGWVSFFKRQGVLTLEQAA